MKAVREVSGVKDIRPSVSESDSGVAVKLHMMVNPERSVPELSQAVQKEVKNTWRTLADCRWLRLRFWWMT
jgi:uncharacterized alkaline shock family protein YloU